MCECAPHHAACALSSGDMRVVHQGRALIEAAVRTDASGAVALLLTLAVVVVFGLDAWLRALFSFDVRTSFITSQYYADYRDGFLRRALPGELLGWLPGQPTDGGVGLLIVVGTVLAVAALLWLAVRTAQLARGSLAQLTVLILLLTSPLSGLALLPRDMGRPDAWGLAGIIGLTALVLALTRVMPVPLPQRLGGTALIAGLVTLLTALTDFLLPFCAVIVALAMIRLWRPVSGSPGRPLTRLGPLLATAVALLPGALLVMVSVLAPPTMATAYAIQIRAGREPGTWDATLFLTQSAAEAWDYVRFIGWVVPATVAVMAVLLVLTGLTLGVLTGRADTLTGIVLGYCAVASLVVAIDVRRYWVIALTVFAACLLLHPRSANRAPAARPAGAAGAVIVSARGVILRSVVGLLLCAALLGQNLPFLIASDYVTALRVALTGGAVP